MADEKKGFIFYTDWVETFKSLPKEKGYDLLMHLLSYVNDDNPKTDDLLINAVFSQIKNTLKRDLKKWQKQQNQRIEAGKKSAEIRKQNQRSLTVVNESHQASTVSGSVSGSVIRKKVITPVEETAAVDFVKFINLFNSYANRSFKINQKIKDALALRRKIYSAVEIATAIKNAHLDKYHIENNFKYLTPEFILRPDKLERFLNQAEQQNENRYTPIMPN